MGHFVKYFLCIYLNLIGYIAWLFIPTPASGVIYNAISLHYEERYIIKWREIVIFKTHNLKKK